jgi:hypothetical protein
MNLSPHYSAIHSRAVELLRAGSINNHPWPELKAYAASPDCGDKYCLINSVGVALCQARDELWEVEYAPIRQRWEGKPPIAEINKAHRRVRFNKGNFARAQAEIIRELREGE